MSGNWIAVFFLFMVSSSCIAGSDQSLLFQSTQLSPPSEAQAMRDDILAGFSSRVDFQGYSDRSVFQSLILADGDQGRRPDVIGASHGDFASLTQFNILEPLDQLSENIGRQRFVPQHLQLGNLHTDKLQFIPWMQATYLMVANRRALKYLPENADLNNLSYSQLRQWAENMKRQVGKGMLGFPAASSGLMHRFIQGYLYPSYTEATVTGFNSNEALSMWREFRGLWRQVDSQSMTYSRMDKALLSDEVWVAWDHTARLFSVFDKRPEEFVAFPAPVGPRGRGFMLVLAGLGIPNYATSVEKSESLIKYLTQADVQIRTLEKLGFFPVVNIPSDTNIASGFKPLHQAVASQAGAANSISALLPVGLKSNARAFNLAYMGAFSRIILRGKDIKSVLAVQARKINQLLAESDTACWLPDPVGPPPCKVR